MRESDSKPRISRSAVTPGSRGRCTPRPPNRHQQSIRNQQSSAISNQSAIRNPQSAMRLLSTEHLVERLRVRKDEYEIATMREAAARLSAVASGVLTAVRRGETERDLALAIDVRSGRRVRAGRV